MNNINYIIDIDINISKEYLKKSLLSCVYRNIYKEYIKLNNSENYNIINLKFNNDNTIYLQYLYTENNLSENEVLQYISLLLSNTYKYTKNIYPEFGNDWTIIYNISNDINDINNTKNNICIVS
jgi:hypothetical protein